MKIPFLNLKAQHDALRTEIEPVVLEALNSGHYVLGPNVSAFENEIASFTGAQFGTGVNSGSDALTLSLRALDVGPGDEVITTPFTYIAPAESIHQMGAKIVFADIRPDTFCIDLNSVEEKITERTKAIIPVHLFGQMMEIDRLIQICKPQGIHVVEDCAQAIGSKTEGRHAGSFGAVGCFSFYPTKNLGADGDGGMIITNDESIAKRLRMLRVHGIEKRYYHDLHGFNSRLDELQAAILRVKLRHLDEWNERRRAIAQRYDEAFTSLPVDTPATGSGNHHIYHVYAILSEKRDALKQHLEDNGIPTLIYYPLPLHRQRVYQELELQDGDYPVAEKISENILPLPMYPELTDEQVDYIIATIQRFF